MIPIAGQFGGKFETDEFDKFKNYLLDICKKHKKEHRALAFAFIVYDFQDYTIQKIVGDKHYWQTLDKIAGEYLTIFYIDSDDSYYNKRRLKLNKPNENSQTFLCGIKTPFDGAIRFIKEEFQLDDNIKTPFVLFFQTDGKKLLDYFFITLKQEKLEDAFLELKAIIKNAADSVSKVLPENYKNYQEIFNLIRGGVENGQFWDFVKIVSRVSLRTIISPFEHYFRKIE